MPSQLTWSYCLSFLEVVTLVLLSMLTDVLVQGERMQDSSSISLEGSVTNHDVLIGSNVNLTCKTYVPLCGGAWYKNKRLDELENNDRIQWIRGKRTSVDTCTVTKLMIKNFTFSDQGTYRCIPIEAVTMSETDAPRLSFASLHLYAVRCYQGYYCPEHEDTAKRCPKETFSLSKDATTLEQCKPCPENINEDEVGLRKMEAKTLAMFQTNCPNSLKQQENSAIPPSIRTTITVLAVMLTVTVFLAILYTWQKRKTKSQQKLLDSLKDVEYDPPKVPRSKDVFVCYSSKNRQWVHDVLLVNLRAQDFKVFIDFVDFEIGKTIDDNIVKGIYNSRKTLFILSKDSLKSWYARKELYHALAAGKNGHQVLVILYEKCKAPVEISNFVYLDWTDEKARDLFWQRLYAAIKRPLPNERMHEGSTFV